MHRAPHTAPHVRHDRSEKSDLTHEGLFLPLFQCGANAALACTCSPLRWEPLVGMWGTRDDPQILAKGVAPKVVEMEGKRN